MTFGMNDHEYWDREREEGPTDWGSQDEGSAARDPTAKEWAGLQAELDRERQMRSAPASTLNGSGLEP